MRSVAEIENDLNAAKLRLSHMDDSLYSRQSPAYRAARFDYILSGDRSGLDAQQRALEQAYQQAEQRKATEQMARIQQGQADEDKDDEIIKELSSNRAILEDLRNNPNTAGTAKEKQQQALVNYWTKKARKRGLSVEGEDEPETPKTTVTTPAQKVQQSAAPQTATQTVPEGRSWKQIEADASRLADSENSAVDELEAIKEEIEGYRGNDFTTKEANSVIARVDNRIKTIKDKDVSDNWLKKKDEVDAAIKAKDTARLKELQGELEPFAEQKDYATTKQKVDAALKPKSVSPFPKWVKDHFTFDKAFGVWGKRGNDYNTKGKQSFNETIDGKSYTGWLVRRSDGGMDITDDNGKVLKTFAGKAFESGEEKPSAPKSEPTSKPVVPEPTVPAPISADGKPKLKRVLIGDNEEW